MSSARATGSAVLAAARDAYAQRHWSDALAAFHRADGETPLDAEDLERLAWTSGMLDRDEELLATGERVVDRWLARGAPDRAAYWAFFTGFRLLALGEQGRATAWLQRSRRLADEHGDECAAVGFLLLPQAFRGLATGDLHAAAAAATEALAIGRRCGGADLAALAGCLLGRALVRQGQVEQGVALLDEAMLAAVGGALGPIVTGLVYCNVIATCRQIYELDRAREWTDALARWCGSQPQLVQFNGICLVHRAEILELNGAWQQAVTEARRATRSLARAIAAETEAGAAYQEAEIHRLRGEYDEAQARYTAASRLGLDPQPGLALLRLAQGQAGKAATMLSRALAASNEPLARARLLPAAVEVLVAADRIDEARGMARELADIAARYATDILAAMAAHAQGTVALAAGDPGTAIAGLRPAFATWQRAGAPYIAARIRVAIGLACRALADEDCARLELEAALETFERLGAGPERARVAALLGTPAAAKPNPKGSLSPRELEVLRLLAQGCTNRQAASRLGLSEKTIDRHVSNIFDKLAVSSRTAATAIALRRGLL